MFVAYLLDNDTVAYGIGLLEIGKTKEEAITKLRATWERDEDRSWDDNVEDGESLIGWGTEKMRLFVFETK